MSVLHYGGDTVGLRFPICRRGPSWVGMTNTWESVTCKSCLKKRPGAQCNHDLESRDKTVRPHEEDGLFGWKCSVCDGVWMPVRTTPQVNEVQK